MTPIDIPMFTAAVLELADALGHRAPTPAGMTVWLQTMKEFPFPDVRTQLDAWAKRSTKMPAPADLWKACNDARTERIEQQAKVDGVRHQREADAAFKRSDKLGLALRALAVSLRDQLPRDPKEWAHSLWHRYIADGLNGDGNAMSEVQIGFACTALHRTREQANEIRSNYRASQARGGEAA